MEHLTASNVEDTASSINANENKVIPLEAKDSGRYCWVCFATDEDDETAAWVQPCNCRGTTKWVLYLKCPNNSILVYMNAF